MCIVFYRQEAPLEPILMGCGNYILSMVPRIDAARFRATRFDVHLITIIAARVSNHGYHVLQTGLRWSRALISGRSAQAAIHLPLLRQIF